MRTQTLCSLMYDLLIVQHADLDSIRADVLKNAVDLPADEIGRHSLHAGHMKGVLRDDSRNNRHAVYPVCLEGLGGFFQQDESISESFIPAFDGSGLEETEQ